MNTALSYTLFLVLLTISLTSCQEIISMNDNLQSNTQQLQVNTPLTRSWSQLYVTWAKFNQMPMTENDAISGGWTMDNSGAGGDSSNTCSHTLYQGKRYVLNGDLGIMLLFDINGELAGLQTGSTLQPTGNLPPWDSCNNYWVLTSYFRDPASICSSPSGSGNPVGDRVWLKNGTSYIQFPLMESQVNSGGQLWVKGKCFWTMGNHYWWNISPDMSCDTFFPVFLLYNQGVLNGFGFAMNYQQDSARFEHPHGDAIKMFFQPQDTPTCLVNLPVISTVHFYLNSPFLDYC